MITIGIIGSNGQVGTETCLYLSLMDNVQVIPISRTEFGAAFLNSCGIKCRIGNISNPEEAKLLLENCNLIADFTYLKGLPSEIKESTKRIITNTIKYSSPDVKFVYASSMMAYGMGKDNVAFKNYLFARSVYGTMKRYSEKLATCLGRKFNKKTYILRIGQVHGELQSVSRKYLNELNELKDETTIVPDSLSYTVFPFTIAEALVNIAHGKEKEGLYTLVSKPEWSWKEVHEYYCNKTGITPKILIVPPSSNLSLNCLKQLISNFISKLANYYAEVIASYILIYFPKIEKRFMAIYYIKKAKSQIYEGNSNRFYTPLKDIHYGKILGKRLQSISDSRENINKLNTKIKDLIKGTVRSAITSF